MAINPTIKLVWLVKTIHQAGKIPFKEIQQKWRDNEELSGGVELPRRTFNNWLFAVWDTFGLDIQCEKSGDFPYYISNEEDLRNGSIENWLLNSYSVSNSLVSSRAIKDKILLEDVPSSLTYLDDIIDAIKKCRMIHIGYRRYGESETKEHYLMPLCVRLFHQRWYVVGRIWASGCTSIFSLDRITSFRLSSHSFDYPEDFHADEYFKDRYGVIVSDDVPVDKVVIKSTAIQANYLRDLPLASNQVETERNAEYSIFELTIRPTYDFIQQLLWNGETIEVLQPKWLRKVMKERIKAMLKNY
ncbi:MAG: WYL domain-containing protein [Paludibacteraceae bacterium]|nr:WYL domain-containing protein [Paludibacteraceae bacterium]